MAVLIGVDEFQRLQAQAGRADRAVRSPLPPELVHRQGELVARARRLEERLGDPIDGLAELFNRLPPDGDDFWVEILAVT